MSYEIRDTTAQEQVTALAGESHLISPPLNCVNVMLATTEYVNQACDRVAAQGLPSTIDVGTF